jgi:hypothetical protein
MVLYYPAEICDLTERGDLFSLLKPFLKSKPISDKTRIELYGVTQSDYAITDQANEADVIIVPMSWNYYWKKNLINEVVDFIKSVEHLKKPVWSFVIGDFGVKTPNLDHLTVYRTSGYHSKDPQTHRGMPVLIKDKLHLYSDTGFIAPKFGEKPIVGFCGQANASKTNAAKEVYRIIKRNLAYKLNRTVADPQAVLSSTLLRSNLLRYLESDNKVHHNFIKREQYRAGVTENKDKHQTTHDFYNNILESQYVLAVRGGGNFSVRFYETLMMGRIPLYLHTDDHLPLMDDIDWKKHVVWVDYMDRTKIAEKLVEFHQRHTADSLIDLMKSNRKLWEDRLRLDGFFKREYELTSGLS